MNNEKENLNKQLFKHMMFNLIVFSIIFIIFGIFIFLVFSKMTYNRVDNELLSAIDEFNVIEYDYMFPYIDFDKENNKIKPKIGISNQRDYFLSKKIDNPKIVFILRNNNYEIINDDDLGINYDKYYENLEFDPDNLNKIYEIHFNNTYYYRVINLKIESDENNEERYVQLMINVDSEKDLIESYMLLIVNSVVFGIFISVVASYILSRKTLTPIKETVERQNEFVENVSHELRTPLTIIQAKQELLLQEPNSKIIDKLEDISLTLEETKRLSKLTKDLLLLTRADSNRISIKKEEIEIDTFLDNLIKPYIELAEMQGKKFKVDFKFDKIISVDSNKIHQVIVILLDNALKYTEEGDTITVDTIYKDGKCVIDIKDTGIGISDEGMKRVFDRFYREDKARNRETGGSGLGLAIAYSIIKAHNGTIKVSHNKPKGTVFTIKLQR